MEMNENIKEQAQDLVEKLLMLKDNYKNCMDTLAVSIRRDLVAVDLKAILKESNDYESLKQNIQQYIDEIYNLEKKEENKDG